MEPIRHVHSDIEKILIQERVRNHKRAYQHPSYIMEQALSEAIRKGDTQTAVSLLDKINGLERAELSVDPVRSLKNSLIGSCTIFTRAAIHGGVDSESAFMLSDLFIRQIEKVYGRRQAESLEYDMLLAFVSTVNVSRKALEEERFSPLVVRVREYVRQNIHLPLSLKETAEAVNVHPNYLSTVFSKECGQTFITFLHHEKVQSIAQALKMTDQPLAEIAVSYAFQSFSHFSTYFKKHTGLSPRDYRKSVK